MQHLYIVKDYFYHSHRQLKRMVTTEFRIQGHRIHKYFINEKEETIAICIKKIGNDRRSYFFPIKFNV